VLLKSADYFTDIAELFGIKLKIPSFIIGATVVAFGTSLPELAVSIAAIFKNDGGMIAGTVVGSNISNIFLIAGIAILMSAGFSVNFKKHITEFLFLIASTVAISYMLWDLKVTLIEGIILLLMLLGYLVYILLSPKSDDDNESEKLTYKTYIIFVLSLVGIALGAKYTTTAIEKISEIMGLGSSLIAQTVLALGTSLPELTVTIASTKKKQYGIILGNIMGSNIFNGFAVIGIPAIVGALSSHPFTISKTSFNEFAIPLMLIATALLVLLSFLKTTPRFFGLLFLLLYFFFLIGSFSGVNLLELI
jgi:cation:H+ antiporter